MSEPGASSTGTIDHLVIGVPTVRRPFDYLPWLVRSLVAGIATADRERVSIVLLNADADPSGHRALAEIRRQYAREFESGLLSIVDGPVYEQSPSEAEEGRTNWHRKQSLDTAAAFELGARRGTHYLHLEDDVVAAPGYLARIDRFFAAQSGREWQTLAFYTARELGDGDEYPVASFFGSIGLLVRAADALAFAAYIREHVDSRLPVDLLYRDWTIASGGRILVHQPSLFQHLGILSSDSGEFEWNDARDFAAGHARLGFVPTLKEAMAASRVRPMNGPRLLLRRYLPTRLRWQMYRGLRLFRRFQRWVERKRGLRP